MIDIFAKLERGDYEVSELHPVYEKPKCFECNQEVEDALDFCPYCGANYIERCKAHEAEFEALIDPYLEEVTKRFEQFVVDVVAHCGISGNLKAIEAFSWAYDRADKNLRVTVDKLSELAYFMRPEEY